MNITGVRPVPVATTRRTLVPAPPPDHIEHHRSGCSTWRPRRRCGSSCSMDPVAERSQARAHHFGQFDLVIDD